MLRVILWSPTDPSLWIKVHPSQVPSFRSRGWRV